MERPPQDPEPTILPDLAPTEGGPAPRTMGSLGDYTLVRELGRGGMGVVYEALEPGARRVVALKVLDVAGRGYDLDLALREARLMAKVSHPNTVFLYRADSTPRGLLLAMELVRGGTIAELLRREGRLPVPRAVALALQLIEGLRAYHCHGIVHRDIKPANCFLDADGRARIGDLGIARSPEMASRLTQEGRFLGTPHYSSPEQLRGEAVDQRADLYSFAATLYEMITGVLPFKAPDAVTLVARIMSDEPELPSKLVPGVPPGLDRAILRALSKKPERRFTTLEEFAQAIAPFGAAALPEAGSRMRAGAAVADFALFTVSDTVWEVLVGPGPGDMIALIVSYFLVSEVLGRASPMKWLLGLRIVARDGSRAGLGRALARASIKLAPFVALVDVEPDEILFGFLGLAGALALFVPMKWEDGFLRLEGSPRLHDLLTGTRVVHVPSDDRGRLRSRLIATLGRLRRLRRSGPATAANASRGPGAATPPTDLRFGTFMARRCLVTYDGAALWVADDPLLRRQVWILHHGRDAERCAGARRAVERPSRLRWIATGEAEGRPWDAYDAPHPAPSLWACSTGERRRPWREGRRELRSLAVEIVAAREDGTLPSRLSLAQIVAGPEGRILLLDRTFEPDSHDMELFDTDPEGLRSFFQVTVCALATGHIHRSNEIARRVDVARLPVWDHELLGELWNPSHDPIETIASMPERLRDELRRGGELTVRSRITYLLGIAILSGTLWVAAPEVIPGMIEMTSQAWAEGRAAAEGMNAPPMEWARTAWSFPPWLAGLLGFLIPIVSALAFRGGLGLRLPALEVCTTRGRPAGPWRLFLRSLPLALATAAVAYTLFAGSVALSATILVLLFVVALAGAFLSPARSLIDLIARTFVRPR